MDGSTGRPFTLGLCVGVCSPSLRLHADSATDATVEPHLVGAYRRSTSPRLERRELRSDDAAEKPPSDGSPLEQAFEQAYPDSQLTAPT